MLTEKVIQAIAKVKEISEKQITIDSSFEDLQADSLDAIEILFELEEEYDLDIPTEQLQSLRTVRDVVDGIQPLLDQQAAEGADGASAQA